MNKIFNSARYYNKFVFGEVDKIRVNAVLKLIGINKKVLDIGCGDGFIMERIRSFGNEAAGIEISKNAIIRARKKGFKVFDVTLNGNWSAKIKGKYDVVFGGEIIEHIFDTDNLLFNIKKVLNRNGALILTTPNIASLGRRLLMLAGKNPLIETTARKTDAGHIRYFTRNSLTKLLEENGFDVISVRSTVVNFGNNGKSYSKLLANVFPGLGNNIIIKAIRKN